LKEEKKDEEMEMQIEDLYNKDKKKVPSAGTGDIKILHKVGTGTKKLNI